MSTYRDALAIGERACKFCGDSFTTRLAYVKRGGGIYCSVLCRNRGIGKQARLGRKPVAPKAPTPEQLARRKKLFPSNVFSISKEREARFWLNVDKTSSPDGCWLWTGYIANSGYATLSIGGKSVLGHRVSAFLHGIIAPAGHVIDHICRNRACVNPAHLRVATLRQNACENSISPARFHAQKSHCKNGHPLTGDNLMLTAYQRRCRACDAIWSASYRAAKKGASL